MFASIKSEYRKLLTIRTTYFTLLILFAFVVLFAFYAHGIREVAGTGSGVVGEAMRIGSSILAVFSGVIGLMMVTQEYRYSTIMYTLTASNSRAKSLLAKMFVLTTVSIFLTLFFGALIAVFIHLGAHFGPAALQPQTIYYKDIIWQTLFSSWAIMMYAVLLSVYIRHQVGAVVAYFLIPSTIENILAALIKGNGVYLPFSIASAVSNHVSNVTPVKAAAVTLVYLVIGSIIAITLFVKRDAN